MGFQGFGPEAAAFLWGVRLNNERPWFEAHKQEYLIHVQAPMRALAEEVYERFAAPRPELDLSLKVCRIYRDARRLHGRGPYRSHLWWSLFLRDEEQAHAPCFWFSLDPLGYGCGMGMYDPRPAAMARFRRELDAAPERFLPLARSFAAQDRFALEGTEYKRPKGHPAPPLDRWYDRRDLSLGWERPADERYASPALVDEVVASFEALEPYYRYFSELVRRAD